MEKYKRVLVGLVLGFIAFSITACSGGGGGDESSNGTDTPTPTPTVSVGGPRTLTLSGELERFTSNADGTRDKYMGYSICSFDGCGTTDANGHFLFNATAPTGAVGINYTVNGPAFSAIVGFPLRSGAREVNAIFLRIDGQNLISIGQVAFDGVVDATISPAGFNDGD